MKKRYKIITLFIIEIFILFLLTAIISQFNLDLNFQQMLFKNGSWIYAKQQPWYFLYHYGTIPGIIIACIALFIYIFSFSIKNLVRFRRKALFVFLTLVLGPGLIVNATFKDRWGRPRPRNVEQFNGKMEFREIYEPGIPGRGKSFPCGHCSMGFYFIVVYYLYKNDRRKLAYSAAGFSLIYGTLIGISRMAQGGHFASDVLWAGGFTILTAQLLYYVILNVPKYETVSANILKSATPVSKRKIIGTSIIAFISIALLIYIYLFSKPVYKKYEHRLPENLDFSAIKLFSENSRGDVTIRVEGMQLPITVATEVNGFGLPNRKIRSRLSHEILADTLKITYGLSIKGKFTELESESIISLNGNYPLVIISKASDGDIYFHNEFPEKTDAIHLDLSAPRGEVVPFKQKEQERQNEK